MASHTNAFCPALGELDVSSGKTGNHYPHQGSQARLLIQTGLCRGLDMRGMNEDREGVADGTRSRVEIDRAEFPPRDAVGEDEADEPGHAARVVHDEVRAFLHDAPIERMHLGIFTELCALAPVERQDKSRQPPGGGSIRLDEGFGERSFFGHGRGSERVEDLGLGPEVPVDRGMRQAQRLRNVDHIRLRAAKAADQIPGCVQDAVALVWKGVFHAR